MISSVFASFAPLLLLALSVTAAPSTTPGTMDLSPITTPKTVLFIDHKMNFTGTTTVYDDTAAAAYTVEPSNGKFLVLKSVKSPSDVKFIQSVGILYIMPLKPLRKSYAGATESTHPYELTHGANNYFLSANYSEPFELYEHTVWLVVSRPG